MVSLYNRASAQQQLVLRMIEGAVRNASDAHPHWPLDGRFAKSIAKRAAGTLTAHWPEVLAARSDQVVETDDYSTTNVRVPECARRTRVPSARACVRFTTLRIRLGRMAMQARHDGQTERYEAIVDVLRMLHDVSRQD